MVSVQGQSEMVNVVGCVIVQVLPLVPNVVGVEKEAT